MMSIGRDGMWTSRTKCVWVCSMWRLICLAFFGAFAWGVTWDMYGVQISSHVHKAIDALQARLSCCRHLQLTHRAPSTCQELMPR